MRLVNVIVGACVLITEIDDSAARAAWLLSGNTPSEGTGANLIRHIIRW